VRSWGRTHRRAIALLALIIVAGGILRAEAASSPSRYQSVDERAYARLARNLARHGRYGDRAMADPVHWPPGAPAVFAAAHELRPRLTEGDRWDVPSAYALQAAFGTALIAAVFVLAALLGGATAGVAAAAAVAFYPPLIEASGDLLTEPLGALMLAVALIAVVLALRRPSLGRGAAAGALLGLTVLVRADLLVLPLVLAAVVALVVGRRDGRGPALRSAGALALATVVVLAPWTAYASSEAGRFTPVSSGGASNLYVGTYLPGDGTMFGLKRALGFPPTTAQKTVLAEVAGRRPERDQQAALRAAAMENLRTYVLGDPIGFAGLAARKVDRLWIGYTLGTHRNARDAITAYHLLLVALGFGGLGLALVRRLDAAFWVPATAVLYVTAVNIVLVSEARHNLPVLPVLVAGGTAGLVLAAQRLPRLTAAMRSGRSLVRRS
jgi:4-amino-4-deoxy-L-arabinose transferase-like glycosyltransferase